MRFRLVKTGKSYSEAVSPVPTVETEVGIDSGEWTVPPIIWETGNAAQIRSLLWLREAELASAKDHLSGKGHVDSYLQGYIYDLEIKINDLKKRLTEAKREHC